ncbi:MAG TPA: hypothetical protein VL598_00080 [Trinickia sp.]|jgi:hypothetical protein|uniref:hypothetical protein n=1 Tax=Trinickia sp. TaxID=2571163 RepID=UPI002CB02E11|nr:hypothetical protein [Trinickia sp.]HTI16046.1 hypothetical protein [Trinickia sp.]
MAHAYTISDFVLIIPMAIAGVLCMGSCPCSTQLKHNVLRLVGAMLGVVFAVLLVEGLPALI